MKNLTIILAIVALLLFSFGCANLGNILTGSSPYGVSAFKAGDSDHDTDEIMSGTSDREYVEQGEGGPRSVKMTSAYGAAALSGLPGAPTHICGEADAHY